MGKHVFITGFFLVGLLICTVITGGAFYSLVLPKFQQPIERPKPEPKKPKRQLYPLTPAKATSVPQIAALPGTTIVRLAYQTSNAHQAWALANMGKVTDPGSIFARHGITMQFRRVEKTAHRISALLAMAMAFNSGETLPDDSPARIVPEHGAHFFTVGGDTSSRAISQTNQALKLVNPAFEAEIVGFSGLSAGEDKFLGLAEWKADPQQALGGVVAAVPYDSAWNIMVFWCAQNDIPFNADQAYYDPNALNLVETDSHDEAGDLYINREKVERIFLADGQDHRGRQVQQGEKRLVPINGVATRTPLDKRIAAERGGLVTVASTKQYPNQTPQLIVGLKQWNRQNQAVVVNMLAALFEASQRIEKSHRDVKAKRLEPKSEDDDRWRSAQYVHELFDAESPDDWYAYYDGAEVKGKRGLRVDVGGATVGNLQRNLAFFGLGQAGPDRGKVVYSRFTQLAQQYDPDTVGASPEWEEVFNKGYVQDVLRQFPELAQADPTLPTFAVEFIKEPQELTYDISFVVGHETLTPESEEVLEQVRERIVRGGDARVEIHGYTDSYGSEESNLELSQRRGETVYNWLKEKLGDAFPRQVRVIPHGENNLLVQDRIQGDYVEELMAQNRRVVLKIFPL